MQSIINKELHVIFLQQFVMNSWLTRRFDQQKDSHIENIDDKLL